MNVKRFINFIFKDVLFVLKTFGLAKQTNPVTVSIKPRRVEQHQRGWGLGNIVVWCGFVGLFFFFFFWEEFPLKLNLV